MTALTSGGAIPDTADYQVLLEPENHVIGSVNEDFAVESMSGDVFQLGNASYRILRVERGTVRVEDAKGQPPNLPFWLGEAPGRTDALSASVSRLRAEAEARLSADSSGGALRGWLEAEVGVGATSAEAIAEYLAAALAALGVLPTQEVVALERFFDEFGRHAARHPFALWQPSQSGVGPGAAQAFLPQVQFRASGGRDRGRDRAVADRGAQFRAR